MLKASPIAEISVILPTANDFSGIRRTVKALHSQTARDRIELIIVAPDDQTVVIDAEVHGFANVKVVNGGPLTTSSAARAVGIRFASASVVALAEDHSFPEPDWAAALIAAHALDYAVVGPVMQNGNPRSMQSWANLCLEYQPWFDGIAGGGATLALPGHNSSYKRDLLLAFGDSLPDVLEVETIVQRELTAAGHRMLLEPAAKTRHLNFSKTIPSLQLRYNAGRSFAGHRVRGWPVTTRLAYIAGAPLIPFVRGARIIGALRRSKAHAWLVPRIVPRLCIALLTDGFGELVGYISGPGNSPLFLGSIEFDRTRFMSASDCRELAMAG